MTSSNGCGMDIGVKNGMVVSVRGRITDRVNKGRLGSKGLNGHVYHLCIEGFIIRALRADIATGGSLSAIQTD